MTGCYRAVHALGRPGRREHLALLILELNIVMIFRSVRAVALAPLRPIVGALDNIRWPEQAYAVLLELGGEPSRETRERLRRQREQQVRRPMIDLLNDLAERRPVV